MVPLCLRPVFSMYFFSWLNNILWYRYSCPLAAVCIAVVREFPGKHVLFMSRGSGLELEILGQISSVLYRAKSCWGLFQCGCTVHSEFRLTPLDPLRYCHCLTAGWEQVLLTVSGESFQSDWQFSAGDNVRILPTLPETLNISQFNPIGQQASCAGSLLS